MSERFAAWVWYRGDAFAGFQRQPQERTVQEVLEAACLAAGAGEVTVMPAGRTDRGVSARMQVVSFRLRGSVDGAAIRSRVEAELKALQGAIGFAEDWVRPAPSFHAQWSATSREYRYRIALGAAAPPDAWAPFVWRPGKDARIGTGSLDPARLEEVLALAEGTHDFHAFHERSSVRKPRRLERAALVELGEGVFELVLRGDSFGRHQVRYLVGAVCLVAAGRLSVEAFSRALFETEPIAGLRAPPEPLVLWEVHYPPGIDPFGAAERRRARGLPATPPFRY